MYKPIDFKELLKIHKDDLQKARYDEDLINRIMLKTKLSEAQNHRCCYCDCIMDENPGNEYSVTLEHVVPKSRGGTDNYYNLVVCCAYCNCRRGSQYIEEEVYAEI